MKVKEITEHEDGSATLIVDMTDEEVALVIEVGLGKLIRDAAKQEYPGFAERHPGAAEDLRNMEDLYAGDCS